MIPKPNQNQHLNTKFSLLLPIRVEPIDTELPNFHSASLTITAIVDIDWNRPILSPASPYHAAQLMKDMLDAIVEGNQVASEGL